MKQMKPGNARSFPTEHAHSVTLPQIRVTFFPRIACLILYLLLLTTPVLAETFVSGEVSGVWDTDGSPYLVTDTLIVPEGDTLLIEPGVTVEFQDQDSTNQYAIIVLGALFAQGEQGDSIYFASEDYPFAGFSSPNTESIRRLKLEYCVVEEASLPVDLWYCETTITNSRIECATTMAYRTWFGVDTLSHNEFDAVPPATSHTITINSEGPVLIIDNSTPNANLHVDTDYYEAYIENNTLGLVELYRSNAYVINNTMLNVDFYWGEYVISGNTIQGAGQDQGLYATECNVTIINNVLEAIEICEVSGTLQNNIIVSPLACAVDLSYSHVEMSGNVIYGQQDGVQCCSNTDMTFFNNTVRFRRYGVEVSDADTTTFRNNIFLGDNVNATGIQCRVGAVPVSVQYNCFGDITAAVFGFELDETNLVTDPYLAGGIPFDYSLQASSPCIDAGDPDSPDDPDDTRADIGCFYYNQTIDNPPVQTIPEEVFAQTGQPLRIQITATDDSGPFDFTFPDLPEWLTEEDELDWVSDTTAVSGIVPEDAEDFSFSVIVEDGEGQTDSSIVSVDVDQRTLLSGEISGILYVEDSPFYVVEDIIVSEGDSLVIEPGCELQFRYVEDPEQRIGLDVYGRLIAEGTVQDGIRFVTADSITMVGGFRGIYFYSHTDTSHFRYVVAEYPTYAANLDSTHLVIRHSRLTDNYESIHMIRHSTVDIDSSEFIQIQGGTFTFLYCYSGRFSLHNSYLNGAGVNGYAAELSIKGNLFVDMAAIHLGGGHAEIINNRFYNPGTGVNFDHMLTGHISNNLFFGNNSQRSIGLISLHNYYDLLISNNIFYGEGSGLVVWQYHDGDLLPDIINNAFYGNSISVRTEDVGVLLDNFHYNCFFNNDSIAPDVELDSTNLFVDPLFADTTDFFLYDLSPLINAGCPDTAYFDLDSTRNDIGLWGGPFGMSYTYPLSVYQEHLDIPERFILDSVYPNPFNSRQTVVFALPCQTTVQLALFNILGQPVFTIDWPQLQAGVHLKSYDTSGLASGVYFVQLKTRKEVRTTRVLLIK